jgi:hypothetical protein
MNRSEIIQYVTSRVFSYGTFGKIMFLPNGNIELYNTYNERTWSLDFDARSGAFKLLILGDCKRLTATFVFSIGSMKGTFRDGDKVTLSETTFDSKPDTNAVVYQPDYEKIVGLVAYMRETVAKVAPQYSRICLTHHHPHEGINIGDAIQYLAMLNLLKLAGVDLPIRYTYRNFMKYYKPLDNELLIINGCMGSDEFAPIKNNPDVLFLGLHGTSTKITEWIKHSKHPIGVRDEYTKEALKRHNIESAMCGCPTLSFEKYTGTRYGIVCGEDSVAGDKIINNHNCYGEFPDIQNAIAQKILNTYMTAELVYTKKLHCALPCIAFGTPVVTRLPKDGRTELLNTLHKGNI